MQHLIAVVHRHDDSRCQGRSQQYHGYPRDPRVDLRPSRVPMTPAPGLSVRPKPDRVHRRRVCALECGGASGLVSPTWCRCRLQIPPACAARHKCRSLDLAQVLTGLAEIAAALGISVPGADAQEDGDAVASPFGDLGRVDARVEPGGEAGVAWFRRQPPPAGKSRGTAGRRYDAPPIASAQVRGCFTRWWQVLGSNQRRLSRRFYRALPIAR